MIKSYTIYTVEEGNKVDSVYKKILENINSYIVAVDENKNIIYKNNDFVFELFYENKNKLDEIKYNDKVYAVEYKKIDNYEFQIYTDITKYKLEIRRLKRDYLTDLYKFFISDKKSSLNIIAGSHSTVANSFKFILDKEIDYFKPNLILCFGNKSIESLLDEKVAFWDKSHKYNGIPVLPSIHIAGTACNSWKDTLGQKPQTATAKAEYIYREIEEMINL